MGGKIRIMPEWLKNQIAAGEVVERPAAVVKELVENALDAGARKIVVEVVAGGRERIRVVDDGHGMNREDTIMALERHATSKCASVEDLREIRTFGFRGEALPSIASVSKFLLRSRPYDEDVGTQVKVTGGRDRAVEDASMAPGTEVIVEDLFWNVPVRRKFLKKDSLEAQAVVEVVQRMALASPNVHFELFVDGRNVISAPPEKAWMARIFTILGKKVCANLYECFLDGHVSVRGFISQPEFRKKGAGSMFTFVNGRFVRDRLILQAVVSGYSTLLERGEYPYSVIDVVVPPGEVDVNVHPTKSEVRFQNSSEVFAAVSRAVRRTLAEAPWARTQSSVPLMGREPSPVLERSPIGAGIYQSQGESEGYAHSPGQKPHATQVDSPLLAKGTPPPAPGSTPNIGSGTRSFFRSPLQYLGQLFNCFLLGQMGDTLVVVDQHAAHERVLFERLSAELRRGKIASRKLLVPVLMELEPALLAVLEARTALVEQLGFSVEPFGGNTVAIKAVPVLLGSKPAQEALCALLDSLRDGEGDGTELFHKPLATMACHMAVRSGDPMDRQEVAELFRQMGEVDLAAYCPHGRPVVVKLSRAEIARWFKRG